MEREKKFIKKEIKMNKSNSAESIIKSSKIYQNMAFTKEKGKKKKNEWQKEQLCGIKRKRSIKRKELKQSKSNETLSKKKLPKIELKKKQNSLKNILFQKLDDIPEETKQIEKKKISEIVTEIEELQLKSLNKLKEELYKINNEPKKNFITSNDVQMFMGKMSNISFLKKVKKLINARQKTWKNSSKCKFVSDIINTRHLIFIEKNNGVLLNLKYDVMLGILANPSKYDNTLKDCLLLNNYLEFQDIIFSHKRKNYCINKEYLIKLISTPAILECYQKTLKWQDISASTQEIHAHLMHFIKNSNVYYISLPDNVLGCTIFDGTIFINSKFWTDISQNKKKVIQPVTGIITTLLHEYSHCIFRLLRGDNIDFYQNTKEKKIDKEIKEKIKDIGDAFDYFLYKNLDYVYLSDCEYIINIDNYQDLEKFTQTLLEKREKIRFNERRSMYKFKQTQAYHLGFCAWSYCRR